MVFGVLSLVPAPIATAAYGPFPKPIPSEAVFIKYNSLSGDAFCSEYHGEFRGVLFSPVLNDGVFRQFGYLDLSLFDDNNDADVRF